MKTSRLSLFSAIVLFFSANSYAMLLDRDAIEQKAVAIERKMTRDRYLTYGLTGLSLAYQFSVLYKEWSRVGGTTTTTGNPIQEVVAQESINKEFFIKRYIKNMLYSFKSAGEYLLCTQDGWIATSQLFMGVGSSYIISKLSEKLVHPDTLRWYINSYAPYHTTIKLMKEQLTTLQDPSVTEEQKITSIEILDLLYNRLRRQAESICAYMIYKIKRFDDEEKLIAQRAQEITMKVHAQFLGRIAAKMYVHPAVKSEDKDEHIISLIDYAAIDHLLDEYKSMLRTHCVHFAMIEGETNYDRSMVKDAQEENQILSQA